MYLGHLFFPNINIPKFLGYLKAGECQLTTINAALGLGAALNRSDAISASIHPSHRAGLRNGMLLLRNQSTLSKERNPIARLLRAKRIGSPEMIARHRVHQSTRSEIYMPLNASNTISADLDLEALLADSPNLFERKSGGADYHQVPASTYVLTRKFIAPPVNISSNNEEGSQYSDPKVVSDKISSSVIDNFRYYSTLSGKLITT